MKAIVYHVGNVVDIAPVRIDETEGNGRIVKKDGTTAALVLTSEPNVVRLLRTKAPWHESFLMILLGTAVLVCSAFPLYIGLIFSSAPYLGAGGTLMAVSLFLMIRGGWKIRTRYEPCISINSQDLRPLIVTNPEGTMENVKYSPSVYDGAVTRGVLTRHFHPRESEWKRLIKYVVAIIILLGGSAAAVVYFVGRNG